MLSLVRGLWRSQWGVLCNFNCPNNISYFWNGGSLLGLVLVGQICSGLLLSFNYAAFVGVAFELVDGVGRDIWGGFVVRNIHVLGSSLFFALIFLHIGRGVYYGGALMWGVWVSGVVLLVISMGVGFLGYILPWGQMSYWGATVITNFLSVVGSELVVWIWGAFSVDGPTLMRFYSLHFLLPFVLVVGLIVHLVLLHMGGNSNPLGVMSFCDSRLFFPYFLSKDVVGFVVVCGLAYIYLFTYDLDEPQNFIGANVLTTPEHIQPEWYFLAAYTVLRAVPSKVGGVVALIAFVCVLLLFSMGGIPHHSLVQQNLFWLWVVSFFCLTLGGACPIEEPYVGYGRLWCLVYFGGVGGLVLMG
uniref:Cytochrome b n=1 Tax=Graffilla buccinicola TaxID=84095 RepID=A0A7G5XUI9_9PLAT|nr:cytochrome b [Graffilla buccinicola]QNA49624.1 cytochrome b [Graffilla buccinicola]